MQSFCDKLCEYFNVILSASNKSEALSPFVISTEGALRAPKRRNLSVEHGLQHNNYGHIDQSIKIDFSTTLEMTERKVVQRPLTPVEMTE